MSHLYKNNKILRYSEDFVAQLGLELFILNPILKGVYNKSNYNRDKKRDNFMFFLILIFQNYLFHTRDFLNQKTNI